MAIICFTGSLSARSHFKRGVDMEVVKSWGAFIAGRWPVRWRRVLLRRRIENGLYGFGAQHGDAHVAKYNPARRVARIGATLQKALSSCVGFFSLMVLAAALSVPLNASGVMCCALSAHSPCLAYSSPPRRWASRWPSLIARLPDYALGYVIFGSAGDYPSMLGPLDWRIV